MCFFIFQTIYPEFKVLTTKSAKTPDKVTQEFVLKHDMQGIKNGYFYADHKNVIL